MSNPATLSAAKTGDGSMMATTSSGPQVTRTSSATSTSSAAPSMNAESVAASLSSIATTIAGSSPTLNSGPGLGSSSVSGFFLGKKSLSSYSSASSVGSDATVTASTNDSNIRSAAAPTAVPIDDSRSRRLKNSIKKTVSAMGSPPTTEYDQERGQSSKRLGVSPMGCSIQSHV
ncbi:hypothetical protein Cpir12675_004453 [Ceratocystis pirilliformis]|uniref:Uncharacterized protein n=1 Tax=Ceratocystis pirilliformis TaxID=259994 RepID=A0ABR3YX75_9PEZI